MRWMCRRDEKCVYSLSKNQKGVDHVGDEMCVNDNIKMDSQEIG
jgi:hypothetical protein